MSNYIFDKLISGKNDRFYKQLDIYSSRSQCVYECAYLLGISEALKVVSDFALFYDVTKETIHKYCFFNSERIKSILLYNSFSDSPVKDNTFELNECFVEKLSVEYKDIRGKLSRLRSAMDSLDSYGERVLLFRQSLSMLEYARNLKNRFDFYMKSENGAGI